MCETRQGSNTQNAENNCRLHDEWAMTWSKKGPWLTPLYPEQQGFKPRPEQAQRAEPVNTGLNSC